MLRWLVPLAFCLASCASFEVQKRQIFLRYLPQADVLDVLLVHEGLDSGRENAERAWELIASLAHGKRFLALWGMLEVDFDELTERAKQPAADPDGAFARLARDYLAYERNITVVEARLFYDKEGKRYCLAQRVRFAAASRGLALIDRAMNANTIEGVSDGNKNTSGDPGTDVLQLARARAGGSWARFEGTAVELSVPMTSEFAAQVLKQWLSDAAAPRAGDRVMSRLLESLTSFAVTGEELRLRFAPAADGWIALRFPEGDVHRQPYESDGPDGPVAKGRLSSEIERLKALP